MRKLKFAEENSIRRMAYGNVRNWTSDKHEMKETKWDIKRVFKVKIEIVWVVREIVRASSRNSAVSCIEWSRSDELNLTWFSRSVQHYFQWNCAMPTMCMCSLSFNDSRHDDPLNAENLKIPMKCAFGLNSDTHHIQSRLRISTKTVRVVHARVESQKVIINH